MESNSSAKSGSDRAPEQALPPNPAEQLQRVVKVAQEHWGTKAGAAAEAEILRLSFPAVYQTAKQILIRQDLAEEAIEAIFTEAIASLPSYDEQSEPFDQWLQRIAVKIALQHRHALQPPLAVVADLDVVPAELLTELLATLDELHRAHGGAGLRILRAQTGSDVLRGTTV